MSYLNHAPRLSQKARANSRRRPYGLHIDDDGETYFRAPAESTSRRFGFPIPTYVKVIVSPMRTESALNTSIPLRNWIGVWYTK